MRESVHNDEKCFSARAETVAVESDEDGWELRITDDDGHVIVINVHAVSQTFAREARKIDRYWADGAALAATHAVNDGDGYDLDDPKHPGWADSMCDYADAARDSE